MKNRISILIVLNIVYYINNFLYTFVKVIFGINGILEFWAFSPYFFIFFTTFVAESSYSKVFNKIKIEARIDLCLRIIAMFVNFYISTLKFGEVWFKLFIFLELLLMSINIYLELRMYNISNKFISNNKILEDEILSKEELNMVIEDYYFNDKINLLNSGMDAKKEIKETFKLSSLVGYSKVLLYVLIVGIAPGVRFAGENYRILMLLIIFIIFTLYIYIACKKLSLFYKDEKVLKKIFIRDNISCFLGLCVLYISEGILYINTGSFNLFIYLISAVFLAPTIYTNKEITLKFHQINKKQMYNKNSD